MIDLDIRLRVQDRTRQFDLAVTLQSRAPVVALFGPSGAGKSLTLQALAGLLRPDAGHVRVAGRTLFDAAAGTDLPPEQRGLGYLFQHYALFPHLTVRDNIAFGLARPRLFGPRLFGRGLDAAQAQRVDALLASFGLDALAHSKPATLSGGQQQRVALARALACEPDLLLLDEPFAALNPLLRLSLREELRQLQRRTGVPMVMITHDIDDVLALADVAFVMEAGAVVREIDLTTLAHREQARPLLLPEAPPAADLQRRRRLAKLLGLGA